MSFFSLLIKELEGRNSLGVKQSQCLFKEVNFIRVKKKKKGPVQVNCKPVTSSCLEERRKNPVLLQLILMDFIPVALDSHVVGLSRKNRAQNVRKSLFRKERKKVITHKPACLLSSRKCTRQPKSWEGKVQYLIQEINILPISSAWVK